MYVVYIYNILYPIQFLQSYEGNLLKFNQFDIYKMV